VKDIGLTLLSEGKTIRIKAHGYSMFPCIKPGSLILIEPLNIKGLPRPGEIIAIRRESGLIVHRLTRIINKNGAASYIARGDSNPYADHPVKIEMIAGRIVRAESTGENPVPADIRINTSPNYFLNRLRVIFLLIKKKIQLTANSDSYRNAKM
jgi:signal peptidase I